MRSLRSSLFVLTLFLAGCILRPESGEQLRQDFDRSGLEDLILSTAPTDLARVAARFDDGMLLLGWRATPSNPAPGARVTLEFFWEAVEAPLEDWKVFVHLEPIDVEGGRINGDHDPAGGRYPTRVWQQGEIVRDAFSFTVPGYLQTSGIEIWTGLFHGEARQSLIPRPGVRNDGNNRAMIGVLPLAGQ